MITLGKFYLHGNKIHPEIFSKLVDVEEITLEFNEISSLNGNIFITLTNLEEVGLFRNKLERIPKYLFINNLKITEIKLQGNKIRFIDANAFGDMTNLTRVNLEDNICKQKEYYLDKLKSLVTDLRRNCTENSPKRNAAQESSPLNRKLNCSSPSSLASNFGNKTKEQFRISGKIR